MPDTENLYNILRLVNAIDDSIGSEDKLTDSGIATLRNDASDLWLLLQDVRSRHQFEGERFSSSWIIARDEANDIVQIIAGYRRPNQLASHVASWRLTSS